MSLLFACQGIEKSYADREILKGISLNIEIGERIGLLGQNGSGKSTLASIIFGSLTADRGTIEIVRKKSRVVYLPQTSFGVENDWVSGIIRPLQSALTGEILLQASKMGLDKMQDWEEERWQSLSGGEQKKQALAAAFATAADLLILDEPSNNLDVQGIEWLLAALRDYPGAVLIISHDRYFLDQSVQRIIEIEQGILHEYAGSYSFYREEKKRRYQSRLQQYQAQEKRRQRIEESIDQLKDWSAKAHRESRKKARDKDMKKGGKEFFRAKAKKRDQSVKSKVKRLEKMLEEGVENPQAEYTPAFAFAKTDRHGRRLLEADHIGKHFGRRSLFQNSSFYVLQGEKVGLVGANGCGKSTFIKMLLDETELDQGQLFLSTSTPVALISQDMNELELDQKVQQALGIIAKTERQTASRILKRMGLTFDMNQALQDISPGEKRKLQIACAMMAEPELLILDEPFNHLDLASREMLEEALINYNGSILLVSHDRYLLENVCSSYLVFHQQRIQRIEGNLDRYWQLLSARPPKPDQNTGQAIDPAAEMLLLETRIAFLCSELNRFRPETEHYRQVDQELNELIKRKRGFGMI